MLAALVQRLPMLRIAARRSRAFLRRLRFLARTGMPHTEEKTAVFAAYGGRSYACSPKAIYEYMRSQPAFRDFKLIWLFQKPERYRFLEEDPQTAVYAYGSPEADRAVARAKYWIFNFMIPEQWVPRSTQVYVQCWHGTPLKKLGLDLEYSENAMNSIREIHERYRENAGKLGYLLSPSPFATAALSSAWGLRAAGKADAVLELGYPRNDFLSRYTQADVRRIREKLGLADCSKRILLYAPTWRDDQYDPKTGYTYDCPVDFDRLQRSLGDSFVILFRAHYLVAEKFDFSRYAGFVLDVSGIDDVNELYVVSDMLITDYSSVFFDYANLCRPILFYMYDLEFYRGRLHAFYLEPDRLPGEIVRDEDALAAAIWRSARYGADERVKAFRAQFCPLDDGEAAKRVVEAIVE